jgi:hypothetical protein
MDGRDSRPGRQLATALVELANQKCFTVRIGLKRPCSIGAAWVRPSSMELPMSEKPSLRGLK